MGESEASCTKRVREQWQGQLTAASLDFGTTTKEHDRRALGYLVGEKLMAFLEVCDRPADTAENVERWRADLIRGIAETNAREAAIAEKTGETPSLMEPYGYSVEEIINGQAMWRRVHEAELPSFIAAIKEAFPQEALRDYLMNVRRLGALGHVCNDEDYETMRSAVPFADDPVEGAQQAIRLDRAKRLLLGGAVI